MSPITNNCLYVDVLVSHEGQNIRISGNQPDKQIPLRWDYNYSSNAFEIVNEQYQVICQIFYARPDLVKVLGCFSRDGRFVAFGSTNKLKDMFHMFNGPLPFNQQGTYLKPMFKYPSGLHLGEYSE